MDCTKYENSDYYLTIVEYSCTNVTRTNNNCTDAPPCYHGYCRTRPLGAGLGEILECVCDVGWVDDHCATCCPLECSNGGLCKVVGDGPTLDCDCPWEWSGELCDVPVTDGKSYSICVSSYPSQLIPVSTTLLTIHNCNDHSPQTLTLKHNRVFKPERFILLIFRSNLQHTI